MAVAWVQVALALACVIRSTRPVLVTAVVASLLGTGVWLSLARCGRGSQFGRLGRGRVGCLLVPDGAPPGFLFHARKELVPPVLVVTSVVPVAVVVITAVALFVAPSTPVAHATTAPQTFASASAALALKTTVPVPGQNSKQFQQILAGNASEQTELKPYVPLDAADQAVLTQQLSQALPRPSNSRPWPRPRRPA